MDVRCLKVKSAGASVQFTTGSRGVRISGSNAGYTMVQGIVKSTGYPLHSPVSPSLPLPRVTVCHHVSTGLYFKLGRILTETFKLLKKLIVISLEESVISGPKKAREVLV